MTDTPTTMGAYLRAARRRRRVSIERAAEDTRIRPDYLMRMESDEFDFLAPTYVRGFLKTYARFLRVNPDPLLEEFDRRYGARVDTAPIIAMQRQRTHRPPRNVSSWTVASIVAATILIGLAAIGLAQGDDRETPAGDRIAQETTAPAEPTPTVTPSVIGPVPPSPSPTGEEIAVTDGIELTVKSIDHECWVGVTADGEDLPGVTLQPGESVTFTADEQMDVVLGYADGIEVIVNGRNIGSPGVAGPLTFKLPDDLDTLL